MQKIIAEAEPQGEVVVILTAERLLAYIDKIVPEVIFIHMDNRENNGYFLIKQLRNRLPQVNVIIVAEQYQYVQELLKLRISGYVIGELTAERVIEELLNLRYHCEYM